MTIFKCGNCGKRLVAVDKNDLPKCPQCGANNWQTVAREVRG